jgi:hypothetical protein
LVSKADDVSEEHDSAAFEHLVSLIQPEKVVCTTPSTVEIRRNDAAAREVADGFLTASPRITARELVITKGDPR